MMLASFIGWLIVLILYIIEAVEGATPTWAMTFLPLVTLVIVTGMDVIMWQDDDDDDKEE